MLRKLLLLLCIISVIYADASPATDTADKKAPKIDYTQIGAPMPEMRLMVCRDTSTKASQQSMTGKRKKRKNRRHDEATKQVLTNEDVDDGANLFVMIFNPTCSHCQDETIMLEKNIALFKKSQLILMANAGTQQYMSGFFILTHFIPYPAVTVGIDSSGFLEKIFLYQALPQINIYDANRRLLKTFCGEASIENLKKYIE
jgi:hypothetical protein